MGVFFFPFFQVDGSFGDFVELLVGSFFFIKRRREQFGGFRFVEKGGPGAQRAVGGNFVVFDFLGGADESSVAGFLFDQLRALLNQSLHGFALFGFGFFAER